jgi:Double-GTPase 2
VDGEADIETAAATPATAAAAAAAAARAPLMSGGYGGHGGYRGAKPPAGPAEVLGRGARLLGSFLVGPLFSAGWAVRVGAYVVGIYIRAVVRRLAPQWFGRPDPDLVRSPDHTPGYPSYYFGQALTDVRTAVKDTADPARDLQRSTFDALRARWYRGAPDGDERWFEVPVALFGGFGAVVGLLAGGVVCATVGVLQLTTVGAFWALAAGAAALLRGVEQVRLAVRRIRLVCPHANCHGRIGLPVYQCGNCGRTHERLRPGRDGVFRHTCECGATLPTALAIGRYRLTAECPHCRHPLPDRIGKEPAMHFLVIGAGSAGKTMLLMSMLTGLERHASNGRLTMKFATAGDARFFAAAKQEVEAGRVVAKTGVTPVPAFLVYVGDGRRTRLLYFYDPPGEFFDSADSVLSQEYLDHVKGLLVVVDPLSIQQIRAQTAGSDASIVVAARPATTDSEPAYNRAVRGLHASAGRRLNQLPMAVVVSKTDAVRRLSRVDLPRPANDDALRSWLTDAGMGSFVRSVGFDFRTQRFFAVSAIETIRAPTALDAEEAATGPLLWLLRSAGLDVADPADSQSRVA